MPKGSRAKQKQMRDTKKRTRASESELAREARQEENDVGSAKARAGKAPYERGTYMPARTGCT